MGGHQSNSAVQVAAEPLILAQVAAHVGKDLAPATVAFESGAKVQVDGAAEDESVLVEIFAHQGHMKGGQVKKVSHDTLKLITLGRSRPMARLILAFADPVAARQATEGTWQAQAIATWGVEVLVVEVDQGTLDGISAAQATQVMVNPAGPAA